jgi:hypothetical protein
MFCVRGAHSVQAERHQRGSESLESDANLERYVYAGEVADLAKEAGHQCPAIWRLLLTIPILGRTTP